MEADAYKALNIEQTYSTTLSDQSEVELITSGLHVVVECKDRAKYSEMVRKARMMENIEQVCVLKTGKLFICFCGSLALLPF